MSKVDKDTALADFDRFTSTMDLDVDVADMDLDDVKNFEGAKGKMIKAMMNGSLIIDTEGQPVFTPVGSPDANAITFYEPTGGSFMVMDKRREGEDVAKTISLLAEMTKQTSAVFGTMKQRDFRICSAIMTLFLG